MFLASGLSPQQDPAHDFWFEQVAAQRSVAGTFVTSDQAMRLSQVYKCVRVIAETVATLPRHVMQVREDGSRERVRAGRIASLLSRRPNRWQTPKQFFMMVEAHKQLRGNGYAQIVWDAAGEPEELVPLHPDRVRHDVATDGLPRYRVKGLDGSERTLLPGEILHVCGFSLDGYRGLNPIEVHREALGSAIAARDYGARYWANDAKPPFFVKFDGKFENDEARRSFRMKWQSAYGGANRHKPAVLDKDLSIHELKVSNADAQWLESVKASAIDICGLFRVPPHKTGILDRATWGNLEQQNTEFVTDVALPNIVDWEQAIMRDLLTGDDMMVEFLLEMLLRGDTATRYAAYSKGILDGWLTRNEVRRKENLDPLPGLDEPLMPLNMSPVGRALAGAPPRVQTPGRAALLMAAAAERIARKEASVIQRADQAGTDILAALRELMGQHEAFVSSVMAVSPEKAAAYCRGTLDRAGALQADGLLKGMDTAAWIELQAAVLLRLED